MIQTARKNYDYIVLLKNSVVYSRWNISFLVIFGPAIAIPAVLSSLVVPRHRGSTIIPAPSSLPAPSHRRCHSSHPTSSRS